MTKAFMINHPDLLCPGCGGYAYCCLCAGTVESGQCRLCTSCTKVILGEIRQWKEEGHDE